MADQEADPGRDELQFDRVVTESTSSAPSKLAVVCTGCRTSIETEYYAINGSDFCGPCRTFVESAADTLRGVIPLMTAGAFGLGAGIVGAVIYYAALVAAIALALMLTEQRFLFIVGGVTVWRALQREAGPGDARVLGTFVVLVVALSLLARGVG